MRLSRKAWNNIVIFSMLLMIFFFNGLHKKLNNVPAADGMQAVLPEQSFILALAFPELKIERIGTSWRSQNLQDIAMGWQANEQSMKQLITQWQTQQLDIAKPAVSDVSQWSPIYAVSIWLAGEQLPAVYQLYNNQQQYYLLDKRLQRVFVLEQTTAMQLFPLYTFMSEPEDA
ncbi:hypothetical protein [Pseudoalteromonas mariniglutinosa]|uniref:hypothetical protein n=1 Tax=Pseudoalteromonas mariniglutinosa TaxID=206042 RepID=UPI00384A46BD